MKRTCVAAAIAGLLLASCAGSYDSREQLRDRVSHFNDAVRWGQYHRAAAFLESDIRSEWLVNRSEWGSDLRIADYEVVDTEVADDGDEATVRVVVSWYRMNNLEVETSMLAQQWHREGREWIMASEETVEGNPL